MYLTKRRQQILKRMYVAVSDYTDFGGGLWNLAVPDQDNGCSNQSWLDRYGELETSSATMRRLFDAGLVAIGWRDDGVMVAELIERGQALVELLS